MHALLNQPIVALALRIVAAACSFAFGIITARLLGIDDFGVVSVLLGFVNVGVVISLLGHETLATREVAALRQSDVAHSGDLASSYARLASHQVWLTGLMVLCAMLFIVPLFPIGQRAGVQYLPILLLIPLVARTRLSQGLIRGAHRASLALVPDGIVRPGLAVAIYSCLLYVGSKSGFVAVMVICALVALLTGWRWELSALAVSSPTASKAIRSGIAQTKAISFSLPIFGSSLIAVLVSQVALISTGLLSTPADAGLYAAAERFALAAALVGQAIYLAVASRLAALHASGEALQLQALIRRVTRGVAAATLLLSVTLVFAAEPLLSIYGKEFSGAVPVLQVLLISIICDACAGPTGQVLLMTRNEKDHFVAILLSLAIQLVLIAWLLPIYGVIGAAWAVVGSTVAWNCLMMYFIKRRLAINPLLAWA